MTCDAADSHLEAMAAGEAVPADVRAHVSECARCARQLALAGDLERMLPQIEPVAPPPRFTPALMSRLQRERWRREQSLDLWFNLAIAAGLLCVATGVWLLFNVSGLSTVVGQTAGAFGQGLDVLGTLLAPALSTYATAAGLLTTALALWWWAESSPHRFHDS
jgi:predicted anti-sigma-YlaC factor YlaD